MMFDRDEVTTLIALLQAKGIHYLIGDTPPAEIDAASVDDPQRIQRLAGCRYPLVEHASISLFILHPELASSIIQALENSPAEIAENIVVMTLATLYLQEWWILRLAFALGRMPSFPAEPFVSFWEQRHLPPPDAGYGRDGFLALLSYQQERFGAPLNFLSDWQNQIDHLLTQEEAYRRPLPVEVQEQLKQLLQ